MYLYLLVCVERNETSSTSKSYFFLIWIYLLHRGSYYLQISYYLGITPNNIIFHRLNTDFLLWNVFVKYFPNHLQRFVYVNITNTFDVKHHIFFEIFFKYVWR